MKTDLRSVALAVGLETLKAKLAGLEKPARKRVSKAVRVQAGKALKGQKKQGAA